VNSNPLELRHRVCLVTGAGRGIGLATARELSARGARGMVLVDLPGDELDAAAASLGDRAIAVPADVTDSEAMRQAVAAALERFGALDVVVANAGIERMGTVRTQPAEDFERVIEVNLLGVYRTLRPALEPVVERRGHLLAVSSLAATMAFPLGAAYGASKAGVDSLMRGLRAELLHTGATAGAAYFGYIDTSMMARARKSPAVEHSFSRWPAWMKRPNPPEAAAQAIVNGVEQRKARVWVPRMVEMYLLLRGLLHPLDDRFARRFDVAGAVRMAEAESRKRQPVAPEGSLPRV
jgi:NAD(P)-dependent dehydrogenase (short-subunit alcohol dehydrogenase family)